MTSYRHHQIHYIISMSQQCELPNIKPSSKAKAKMKNEKLLGSRTPTTPSVQARDKLLKHIIKPISSKQPFLPLGSRLFGVPHTLLQLPAMSSKLVCRLYLPALHIFGVLLILLCMRALEFVNNDLATATVVGDHGTICCLVINHVPHELVRGDDQRIEQVALMWLQAVAPIADVFEYLSSTVW